MNYHKTYFTDRCPNANEFDAYLNGTASNELIFAFEHHLTECELCSVSVEGYKSMALTLSTQKAKTINLKKWISYAAAIIILLTSSIVLLNQKRNIEQDQFAMNYPYGETYQTSKHLNHKSDAEFWYLGQNAIELNDQLISAPEIKDARPANPNSKQIVIEVDNKNLSPNEIIESIKTNNALPVFTFSKTNGLKKN